MTDRKKYYRSRTERMIAGVCGGMAEYLNIDPIIVRVIWVILGLTGGAGLIAYVLFWLLAPEEPAAA
jgi:phage shock protein C